MLAIGENDTVFGIAAGVDLTRRDLQTRAKKAGRPWFAGKNFVGSSPVSTIVPVNYPLDFSKIELRLHVNGELRQNATCDQMIWSPSEILSQISYDIPIEPGDLIIGDWDGILAVPLNEVDIILKKTEEKQAAEIKEMKKIKAGEWDRGWVDKILIERGCDIP